MQRTRVVGKTGAGILAVAVVAGCGAMAGREVAQPGQKAAERGAAALAVSSAGVEMIAAQTTVAEKQVRKALPHSDVQGQAYLEAASDAHAATIASTTQVETTLASAGQQLAELQNQLQLSAEQSRQLEAVLAHLNGQWYVRWGLRVEKAFWTVAIGWLALSAGSVLLGLGNPLGWIGRLRSLWPAAAGGRWIGEAFVQTRK